MSDLFSERETQSYEGIWPSLSKFLLILTAAALTIPIAYAFLPEMKKRKEAAIRIEELKTQIEDARMRLTSLQRKEFLLRNSREYVATIARDRLDLMDAGETIYRLEPAKPAALKSPAPR